MSLVPLFLVSLATVGFETALARYFALAKWSEYGYWVISIVMVGFALSGVVVALFRDVAVRRANAILAMLPAALIVAAAAGFWCAAANPFNPLQLQNSVTWQLQLWNIAGYYVALLPFFFLAGLFVSLSFVMNARRIGQVYGADLTGAGIGSAGVLVAMYVVHAFNLILLLLPSLAASAFFCSRNWRFRSICAAVLALVGGEAALLLANPAEFNDFKAIYAPLHVPGAHVAASIFSPRGDYVLLDDFTERVDTDISNNATMLGLSGPPKTYGLYRDGNRIAALPKMGPVDERYAPAALDALPYFLIPHARVLLPGASGGFRVAEVRALGAASVQALEPEPVLFSASRNGLGPSPPALRSAAVNLTNEAPMAALHRGPYDIIDISADFLDAAEANVSAFSVEALAEDIQRITPHGIVSIPVSIRDLPVYALRVLATARKALLHLGIADPGAHVLVYRSAWSARILLSRDPWTASQIAEVRHFCDERSFDVSWYPGMDVRAARATIYNDLPAVSFETGQEASSDSPDDSIADETGAILSGRPTPSATSFNLSPITLDRPFFYAVLRLDRLRTVMRRLELLPQSEAGAVVNLAVLSQAVLIGALVLLVPLAVPRRSGAQSTSLLRAACYFPAIALGFLFIEIFLIERASFWLNDRTSGFALVLTAMLVCSGVGSMVSARFAAVPRAATGLACGVVIVWSLALMIWIQPLMIATLAWPWLFRAGLLLLVTVPASLALGFPFPLGLGRVGDDAFLPWSWALNGAFSVVATPLANLIAREAGLSRVLFCAATLYAFALLTFPAMRNRCAWHDIPAPSHAAD